MTDYATLRLQIHPLNEWLETNKFTFKKQPIRKGKYEFIFSPYSDTHQGRSDAIDYLKKAASITTPQLQTPWPHYYLALLDYENRNYADAKKKIKKAIKIAKQHYMYSFNESYEQKLFELEKRIIKELDRIESDD